MKYTLSLSTALLIVALATPALADGDSLDPTKNNDKKNVQAPDACVIIAAAGGLGGAFACQQFTVPISAPLGNRDGVTNSNTPYPTVRPGDQIM